MYYRAFHCNFSSVSCALSAHVTRPATDQSMPACCCCHDHWVRVLCRVQLVAGLVQSTGWPAVVAVVGNWLGRGRRGFITGVWNSHTFVGNIVGSMVAGYCLRFGWGWSFVVPAVIIIWAALLNFFTLVVGATLDYIRLD